MFFFFFGADTRSLCERGCAQTAAAAAAAGAEPVGNVAGDAQRRTAGQREFQRERTPDQRADGPQGQAVRRTVQPVPQEEGHQPVDGTAVLFFSISFRSLRAYRLLPFFFFVFFYLNHTLTPRRY